MPIADGSESNEELNEQKYVVIEGKIAYSGLHHADVALDNFPNIEMYKGLPLVEDAGKIVVHKEKLFFAGTPTGSCKVIGAGSGFQGRARTKEIAEVLFGKERVG